MAHPHPDPEFPNRRASDPPEGTVAHRINEAVKPWYGLLTALLLVWGVVSAILLTIGFRVSTPADDVASLRAELRQERTERREADSLSLRDRTELRALYGVTAQQTQEILLVVCTGLSDTEARRIPACRRVLYGPAVSLMGAPRTLGLTVAWGVVAGGAAWQAREPDPPPARNTPTARPAPFLPSERVQRRSEREITTEGP